MKFTSELEGKEEFLNKEIILVEVSEARSGSLGGTFAPAVIEYEKQKHQIALGSVLLKQYEQYLKEGGSLPARGKIIKPKGKRYFAWEYLEAIKQ